MTKDGRPNTYEELCQRDDVLEGLWLKLEAHSQKRNRWYRRLFRWILGV